MGAKDIPHTRPSIAKNGLRIVHEIFGLVGDPSGLPGPSHVVLIAIDFENIANIKNDLSQDKDSQVGLAILDTKVLHKSRPSKLISTYNFATGSSSYVARASRKFLFGKSAAINPTDMLKNIESLIPEDRNVVLVGHAIRNELEALHALGFKFSASISGILDTFRIANEVFEFWGGSLGDLLGLLSCPFDKLHCGGNDANFTLRALLLLAVRGCTDQDGNHATLTALRQISTSPIPYRADPEAKAAKKKAKRMERSRRHQSKSWDNEKQDQIRAERAAKKLEAERTRIL